MAAGSIIIDLLLKTGSFQTDTDRAAKSLNKLKNEANAAGKALGDSIAKLGALTIGAGTIAGFTALVKSTIDANDHLNDLSKKTGVAIETLGGIGFAATQAGGNLEGVTNAFVKLDKSIASALGGNKTAIADFADLGITLKDLQTLTPDQIFAKLADGFAGAEEGALSTAAALNILGKSGAEQLSLLKDGGEALLKNIAYYKRFSGVTAETGNASDQFNDTLGKIKLLSGAFAQTLTAELLRPLQNLADLWLENKEKGDQFKSVAETMASLIKAIGFAAATAAIGFVQLGKTVGGALAVFEAVKVGNLSAALNISKETFSDIGKAKDQVTDLYEAIFNGQKKVDANENFSNEGRNHPLKKRKLRGRVDDGAAKDASNILKKQLDGQIKLIQDFAKSQADAFQVGNTFLEGAYRDAQISQKDFFTQQKNIRDEALQSQIDAIDKEIAVEQRRKQSAPKGADREQAEQRIALLVQQRSDAVTKASATDILATQSEAAAVRQLGDAYGSLRAQVLQASGDDAGAALIRNEQELRRFAELVKQVGGDPSLVQARARQLANQVEAAQIQKDYNKLLDETSRREQEIFLNAANGGKGELETLAAIRDARKEAIVLLQQQAQAAANLAAVSGTDEDKKRAADLALSVKKAASEIDPLAQRINKSLEDSLSDPLADFIKGTKSASQAFKDFGANVASEIANIAAKDLAKSLFGGGNGQGGIGSLVSGLFSGGGSGSGSSGSSAGLFAQFASFFGGFFAEGGRPPMGKVSVVGENGPEFFVPHTAGTIVPSVRAETDSQRGSMTVQNHFTISGPVDRRTEQQIANAAGRGVQRATSRYS